jgi:hypothetical protein
MYVRTSSCKVSAVFPQFNEILILSTDFNENPKFKVLLKSAQWELSRSMQAVPQTDITNVIVVFRNCFAKAPEVIYVFMNSHFRVHFIT